MALIRDSESYVKFQISKNNLETTIECKVTNTLSLCQKCLYCPYSELSVQIHKLHNTFPVIQYHDLPDVAAELQYNVSKCQLCPRRVEIRKNSLRSST